MTTASDKNLYVQDGQLYIFPSLTSEDVPDLMDEGKTYKLPGCTGVDVAPPPPPTTNTTGGHNATTGANGGNATTGGGNATTGGANTNGGNGNTNTGGGAGNNGNGNNNNRDDAGNAKRWLEAHANTKRGAGGGTAGGGPSRNGNTSSCSATTSSAQGTVVNPVMSARLTTRGTVGVTFGRVEVVAKVPRG